MSYGVLRFAPGCRATTAAAATAAAAAAAAAAVAAAAAAAGTYQGLTTVSAFFCVPLRRRSLQ